MKDPYDILGVRRRASQQEIKRAYRTRARELHPDNNPGSRWAEDDFKDLAAAYALLSDPETRAAFDSGDIDANGTRVRRGTWSRGRGPGRGPFKPDVRRQRGKGATIKVRGADISYAVDADFLEAAHGIVKRIALTDGRTLEVRVPAGTEDGQTLRLKGQGTAGIGGGDAGDALVEVRVAPHPLFVRKGADVHVEVPVTLPEAVLGGRIEAPTIDGPVTVTVPEGANSGTVLRLRGKGLAQRNGGRGDQYVTLKVVLPPKPDKDLAAFVRKWGAKHPYRVRGRETGGQ